MDLLEQIFKQAEAAEAQGISPALMDRYISPEQMVRSRESTQNNTQFPWGGVRKEKPAFAEELFAEPYTYETTKNPRFDRGFKLGNQGSKRTFTNRTLDPGLSTRRHEAEHALRGMNGVPDYRTQFNKNAGKSGSHAEMLGRLRNKVGDLSKKYPDWDWKAGYLGSTGMERAVHDDLAFEEILADMAAFEKHQQSLGKDFRWEKEFPEAFNPRTRGAFDSLTGLRQTITDPKDIPSASMDTGQRWYKR